MPTITLSIREIGTKVIYTYNEDGIRTTKLGSNFFEKYTLEGSKIIVFSRSHEGGGFEMYFNYDEQGNLVDLNCEGKEYFYIRDILGNIIKIVDEGNVCVVEYEYDAWGNFTRKVRVDCYVSYFNPFVYKGYYYDSETQLYWVSSRYYSPELCRWLSPDSIEYLEPQSINELNLYVYCNNDPINKYDPTGHFAISLTLLGLIIGTAIGATAGGIAAYNIAKNNGSKCWELFGWTMAGIVGGGVVGGALGAGVGALVTKATGVI